MDKLKCLLYIAKLSYKTNATYKQSNLFGIIVNSFWLIIQMYILVAFIKHGISSPYSRASAMSFSLRLY